MASQMNDAGAAQTRVAADVCSASISSIAGDTKHISARIIAPSANSGGQNPGRPAPEAEQGRNPGAERREQQSRCRHMHQQLDHQHQQFLLASGGRAARVALIPQPRNATA